jgi:Flp pilus assembly protein TadB
VAKYNVGVGDAFPLDQPERPADAAPPPGEERSRRDTCRRDWRERRRHYRYGAHGAFQAVFILLGIWLVLFMVNGHSVRGLLIAAGIVGAVGLASHFFGRAAIERREQRREERRAECRRRRDERAAR